MQLYLLQLYRHVDYCEPTPIIIRYSFYLFFILHVYEMPLVGGWKG